MNTAIPDLWSDDIKVDVLPPLAILKAQEGLLARKTQGMLEAKLTTMESGELVQHQLDLVAPSLDFYRERLLTATHKRSMLYPVTVTALCFATRQPVPRDFQLKAATDEEFVRLVREVLQSADVRALISSLIARINQDNREHHGNGEMEQKGRADASPEEN